MNEAIIQLLRITSWRAEEQIYLYIHISSLARRRQSEYKIKKNSSFENVKNFTYLGITAGKQIYIDKEIKICEMIAIVQFKSLCLSVSYPTT
jgi:hypothetical protein